MIKLKYFSVLCTYTLRVNNYVSRQAKAINKRDERTKNTIVIANALMIISQFLFVFYNYLAANKLILSMKNIIQS